MIPYHQAVPELQPDGSAITTGTDSRIMSASMVNGVIVAAHAVSDAVGNVDEIQWYEIDASSGTPTLMQQGDVTGGPNTYYAYPAIAINQQGDIGMVFTASGTTAGQFMSTYVTGRAASDTAGAMNTPVLVQAGQANYAGSREGDMSGINVDSDGSFWGASEVAQASGDWATAVAHFTISPSSAQKRYVRQRDGTAGLARRRTARPAAFGPADGDLQRQHQPAIHHQRSRVSRRQGRPRAP